MAVIREDITLPAGPLRRIHINTLELRRCVKEKADAPCVIVREGSKRYYGRDVQIEGPSRLIQSLDKPMPGCGARIWVETHAAVVVFQVQSNTPEILDSCAA